MSEAQRTAESFGIPPNLFWGICEYLEVYLVKSSDMTLRYSANTRAHALGICRQMHALRLELETL